MSELKVLWAKLATNPTLVKAFHTFWQSFVVVFAGGLFNVFNDFHNGLAGGRAALLALVLAAIASGLSALKSAYVARKSA